MPVGEEEVGVEEDIFRFSYVEEPLGHGMPDTLGVEDDVVGQPWQCGFPWA